MGLFTVHNQGGQYFFKHTKVTCILLYNLGGCLYFPLKHKSAMYNFVQQRGGGWVPKGPKSQKYVQMCIHVCTFVI